MGSLTPKDNLHTSAPPLSLEQQVVSGASVASRKNASISPLHDSSLLQDDHNQLVARATKDAIRDLDLTTGQLTWPQGLRELFGYGDVTTADSITFWSERVHSDDCTQVENSIN